MDSAVQAWLLAQLGTSTNLADLVTRYTRLRAARAVAVEVLRERHAELLAQPAGISVSNVVNLNTAPNIAALERKIAALEAGEPPAPDDPTPAADTGDRIGMILLQGRPRR